MDDRELPYCKRFTGVGKEYDVMCGQCLRAPEVLSTNIRTMCASCFAEFERSLREYDWEWIDGRPQIAERATGLHFEHEIAALQKPLDDAILDLRPIESAGELAFIALTAAGDLVGLDLAAGTGACVTQLPASRVDVQQPVTLHLSPDGSMAAAVNTRGPFGVVFDLITGQAMMHLNRGTYHVGQCVFPCAFFQHGGRLLLVHPTGWNRLDVSDPRTGQLLTDRQFVRPQPNEPPDHYLDYFHCGLTISPKQDWIADNGWVWHPAGIVRCWNVGRWVAENVWESEDGPSIRKLNQRWYYWDGPLCWVGNQTLAVGGYGNDDEWLIPAACLYDVESGNMVDWFPGPEADFIFDTYLFSLGENSGASVWDVATGERLLHEPAFGATSLTRYHRVAKCFVTPLPDGAFRVSRLIEP